MAGEYWPFVLRGDVMYTNADMTLYHWNGSGYERKVVEKIFWDNTKISNITKTGRTDSDSVKILVPASSAELSVTTGKDLVVKGKCEAEFDNTSQSTISESLKKLKAENEVFTISSIDEKLYGSPRMQHYELSCK